MDANITREARSRRPIDAEASIFDTIIIILLILAPYCIFGFSYLIYGRLKISLIRKNKQIKTVKFPAKKEIEKSSYLVDIGEIKQLRNEEVVKLQFEFGLFPKMFPKEEIDNAIKQYIYELDAFSPLMASVLIFISSIQNRKEQVTFCVAWLIDKLQAILLEPDEEEYRVIPFSDSSIEIVTNLVGGKTLLRKLGFIVHEDFYVNVQTDKDRLSEYLDALSSASPIKMEFNKNLEFYEPSEKINDRPLLIDYEAVDDQGQPIEGDYVVTLLRFCLPDNFFIQATFNTNDTLQAVHDYVKNFLKNQDEEFYFVYNSEKISDYSVNLKDFAPFAVFNIQFVDTYLSKE